MRGMRGTTLGAFILDHPIGRGGMAEVWRAHHAEQGVPVAVKIAPGDPEAFAAEVEAVARLDHPHVVRVYDHGRTEEGRSWLAMELCQGGSLAVLPPTGWVGVRRAAEAVIGALAHAHAREVVHRDLTPANVLLAGPDDLRPGAKLTDFGLAFARPRAPGEVLGTPAWMAPELFSGEPDVGPWSDLYAAGALLWYLLTGAPPFGMDRPVAAFALAHAELSLPTFEPRVPVPSELPELLRWLLAKDPGARPGSAAEVLEALRLVDGEPPPPPAPTRARRAEMRLVGTGLGLFGRRPVPLVGRDAERAALSDAFLAAVDGEGPLVRVIRGEPGLGATRLCRWLVEEVRESGRGDGAVASTSLPAALARALRVDGRDPGRLERRLRSLGASDPYEWHAAHALLFPEDADRSGALRLTSRPERVAALRRLLARLSARHPFVLVLDHHEGDGLLEILAEAPELDRLLVLVAGVEVAGAPTIDLGPLAIPHQIQLVEGLLALSSGLAAQLRARAAGNPGFMVQIVADLVARGRLVPGPEGFVLAPGAELGLPASLGAWWLEQLGAAGPLETLELAAVLGPEVVGSEWDDACSAAGLPEPTARPLVTAGLAEGDEVHWHFKHPLAREALLARAEEGGRLRGWHDAAAAALRDQPGVTDRLGLHLLRAGRPEEAAPVLVAAARRAVRLGEDTSAETLVDALEAAMGDGEDATAVAARLFRAQLLTRRGQRGQARALAESALGAIQGNGWDALLPAALSLSGELARLDGDPGRARALLEPALARAEAAHDTVETAHVLRHLAHLAAWSGELGTAARRFQAAQVLFSRTGTSRGAIGSLLGRVDVARRAGEGAHAAELAASAEVLLARTPWRRGQAELDTLRGDLARDAGLLDEAVRRYRAALVEVEDAGAGDVVAPLLGLTICLDRLDRPEDARRTLAAAVERGAGGYRQAIPAALDVPLLAAEARPVDGALVDLLDLLATTGAVHPDVADALARAGARLDDERLLGWAEGHRAKLRR